MDLGTIQSAGPTAASSQQYVIGAHENEIFSVNLRYHAQLDSASLLRLRYLKAAERLPVN